MPCKETRSKAVRVGLRSETAKRSTLQVGMVGCGRIAEHHLRFATRTPLANVVALADPDRTRVDALADRFHVGHTYDSLGTLLEREELDVLHVLTPPALHYGNALEALKRGIHVLVEKPLAYEAEQVEDLYDAAAQNSVVLCPDFIQIFHPKMQKALAIVESGELGRVLHVDSQLSIDPRAPELTEGTRLHWSFELPGGLLHNYITHPLYLAMRLIGQAEVVSATPKSYGTLPGGVTDHLSIHLQSASATGSVMLSFATVPRPYFVHALCERGAFRLDFDTQTLSIDRRSRLPSSLRRATANFRRSAQLSWEGLRNGLDVLTGRAVPYQGLQVLISQFYASLKGGHAPPVSKELAMAVVHAERVAFRHAGRLHIDSRRRPPKRRQITRKESVLVTGAAGFVGSELTRRLAEEGYLVRGLVRQLSTTERLEQLGVELVYGDVRDPAAVAKAASGVNTVVHLAAAASGSREFVLRSSVEGTRNVAQAARDGGVARVVYLSSMSIYDFTKLHRGQPINDRSPLEPKPQLRGTYSLAKRQAEDIALSELDKEGPAWTILRPSVIVGPGRDPIAPLPGVCLGDLFLCFGRANASLRLVHVEDVVEAIIKLIEHQETRGKVFTCSGGNGMTLKRYFDDCVRLHPDHEKRRVVWVPYWAARCAAVPGTLLRQLSGRGPNLSRRHLRYVYSDVKVDTDALQDHGDWHARGELSARLARETTRRFTPGAGGMSS